MAIKVGALRDKTRENTWKLRWTASKKRRTLVWQTSIESEDIEPVRRHVEHLVNCHAEGWPKDTATRVWTERLEDSQHAKLAAAGLVDPREQPDDVQTINTLYTAFLEARRTNKKSTRSKYEQAKTVLFLYFGADRPIASITKADACKFREWMALEGNQKHKTRKTLDRNTVCSRTGVCRQFFKHAIDSKWLTDNPFEGLKAQAHSNPERYHYVEPETFRLVVDQTDDPEMRAIIALNRLLGFRVPSEINTLRWSDVNLSSDDGHLRVTAPVFPRFQDTSDRAIAEATKKMIRRAKIEPWTNMFNNGRKSAITDMLAEGYPVTDVAAWVGNSPAVIWEHYAMASDKTRRKAAAVATVRPGEVPELAAEPCGPIGGPISNRQELSTVVDHAVDQSEVSVSTGFDGPSEEDHGCTRTRIWDLVVISDAL